MNYDDYMKSVEWDEKRSLRFRMDGFRCFQCGSAKNLQCHHITYERLGNERMSDLITLCSECHKRLHEPKTVMKTEEEKRQDYFDRIQQISGIDREAMSLYRLYVSRLIRVMDYLLGCTFDPDSSGDLRDILIEDLNTIRNGCIAIEPKLKEVFDALLK